MQPAIPIKYGALLEHMAQSTEQSLDALHTAGSDVERIVCIYTNEHRLNWRGAI